MKFKGVVMKGAKKGAEQGYPTANIPNVEGIAPGIYAAKAKFGGNIYNTASYVSEEKPGVFEAHVLGFSGDLYGKEIEIEIVKRIRSDKNETDSQKLQEMIENDIKEIKKCLQESSDQ